MVSRIAAVILFVSVSFTCFSQTKYSRVKFDLSKVNIQDLNKLGLETDHGMLIPGVHFVNDFSSDDIRRINEANIEYRILIDDLELDYRTKKNQSLTRSAPACDNASGQYNYSTPSNYTYGSMGGYHTYEELLIVLDSMRNKYPHLVSAKAPVGNIKTWESNDIWWIRVSDNPDVDEDEPEVLYTALHHAREPNGLSQMIFYLWYIFENYDTNPEVKYLVDNTEMYFMPCVNPDGYLYNQTTNPDGGGFWRKNRRPPEDSDAYGVDLNRNYGFSWGVDDNGSSPNPMSDTYRGPEEFSEPETQAVRDFTIDRKIKIALNYHTFGNLLIHPWGYNDTPTAEDSVFKAMGGAMIRENNFRFGTGSETVGYLVNGDSDDYLYGEVGEKDKIYAMTPEVGNGFWPQQNQIERFNKSCMHQNLVTAHCVLNYYDVRMQDVPDILEVKEGMMTLNVTKAGLKEGEAMVNLVSNSPYFTFAQSSVLFEMETGQTQELTVPFSISDDAPSYLDISFDVVTDNGELEMVENFSFIYQNTVEDTLYTNAVNEIESWITTDGEWAMTTDQFVSSPSSLTDSPLGPYKNNFVNIVVLEESIDLVSVENAMLQFSAKWDIEANYDHTLIQASTDGENWTSLCGKYTRNGNPGSHGTADPLYDGRQLEWIVEEIDLTEYVGNSIQIRLVMVSDGFVELDGFYIDDIRVVTNTLVTTSTDQVQEDALMNVYPTVNEGIFNISVSGELLNKHAQLDIYTNSGQLVYSLQDVKPLNSIQLEALQPGVYYVKLKSGSVNLIQNISIVSSK